MDRLLNDAPANVFQGFRPNGGGYFWDLLLVNKEELTI